jgi:hypothetical protein
LKTSLGRASRRLSGSYHTITVTAPSASDSAPFTFHRLSLGVLPPWRELSAFDRGG